MRKFRPVTVFLKVHQSDALRIVAEATRNAKNHVLPDESVSSLTRTAVERFLQDLEEWDDAVKFMAAHHTQQPRPHKPNLHSLARVMESNGHRCEDDINCLADGYHVDSPQL